MKQITSEASTIMFTILTKFDKEKSLSLMEFQLMDVTQLTVNKHAKILYVCLNHHHGRKCMKEGP